MPKRSAKTLHSDTKREHYVVFSSPVSMVYAWNSWDHDLPFGDKERLAFYGTGFAMKARVNNVRTPGSLESKFLMNKKN